MPEPKTPTGLERWNPALRDCTFHLIILNIVRLEVNAGWAHLQHEARTVEKEP
jgi:hypothetical protein